MTRPDRWSGVQVQGPGLFQDCREPPASPPTHLKHGKQDPSGLGEPRQANGLRGTGARHTGARPEEGARPVRPSRLHLPHARKHAHPAVTSHGSAAGRAASSEPFLPSRSPAGGGPRAPASHRAPAFAGRLSAPRPRRRLRPVRPGGSKTCVRGPLGLSPSLLRGHRTQSPGRSFLHRASLPSRRRERSGADRRGEPRREGQ